MRTAEWKAIFANAQTAGGTLQQLYKFRKSENARFSMQYLCQKAKVPSKGYLGDVMAGRRTLNSRYSKGLADALDLDGIERKIFLHLAERDFESSPVRKKTLSKRIQALIDQWKADLKAVPAEVGSHVLFTRVYCALSVFASPPTRDQILILFKDENASAVNAVLDQLLSCGAVCENDGTLSPATAQVNFGLENASEQNIKYIQECLDFTKSRLREWFPKKQETYFESCSVSVKKSRYLEVLPKIKELIDSTLSELEESTGADEIIHFGIQMFPDNLLPEQKKVST